MKKLITNEEGFLINPKDRKVDKLVSVDSFDLPNPNFFTFEELKTVPVGSVFTFDVECYRNFFYIAFKCKKIGKVFTFERSPDYDFNPTMVKWIMWRFMIVGFNSKNYDLPMIELACTGASCEQLKNASDALIHGDSTGQKITPYIFEKIHKVRIPNYNHIDLIEVAPLNGSLKLYSARLHAKYMQDLPFPPEYVLTAQDAHIVRLYCCNDLQSTESLFDELAQEMSLRVDLSKEYGVDVRSKSDAQIAEMVINSELEKVLGVYPKKPEIKSGCFVTFDVPNFVFFQTQQLQESLETIRNAKFYLDGLGSPIMPDSIGKLLVKIGNTIYKIGMGGLHSQEKNCTHKATDEICLTDFDVESFYPRTVLNQRLMPSHLGESFLIAFETIVKRRIEAKTLAKDLKKSDKEKAQYYKVISDSLKIVINGTFGKLGNKYSTFYAPQLLLQVTLTGQLVLLMLIEALELAGIDVISGNTDGIILKYHKSRKPEILQIIKAWESHTNYKTEETEYLAIYSRDVNNYIAIKPGEGDISSKFLDERLNCKTKGVFSERGSALNSVLSKNPEFLICNDAILNLLKFGTPISKTISQCKDIRRFTSTRTVRGGGEKYGKYLGKVVRWYYAKNEPGCISYLGSGNKVPKSEGGKPLMTLPDDFPIDIDFERYVDECSKMLKTCGVIGETQSTLF